jgi:uncharacterized protein
LSQAVSIEVGDHKVSGLWDRPHVATACVVLAHGAGAGMQHPFMAAVARGLASRDIATLRYQFLYMERGSKRPDAPAVAHPVVRAAVATAAQLAPELPLIAGGKSFGGRMTSQAQALSPLAGVRGLLFLGFPLHAAGKPSTDRAAHLFNVQLPMLFLQGTRDALADLTHLKPVVDSLGDRATLTVEVDADHSFHVPRSAGRADSEVLEKVLDSTGAWIRRVVTGPNIDVGQQR